MFSREKNMNNQPAPKKQRSVTDLILFAAAIFLLFYIPWKEMNSFHHLLLFLYILCVMLRITNIRKVKMREMEMARRKAEREQEAAALTNSQPVEENKDPSSAPAEAISVQEQNRVDKTEENSSL